MIKLIGFVLLALGVLSFFSGRFNLRFVRPWMSYGLLVMGLLNLFAFYAEPGKAYKVYYPWGGSNIVTSNGLSMDFLGRKSDYQIELPFKYIIHDSSSTNDINDMPDNIYTEVAKKWEFCDAVKADIGVSVILGINPKDHDKFSDMVDNTQTEERLVFSRILPNINNAIKNSCKLMSAQDYISGEAANFDKYFRDQLEYGMYVLEETPRQTDVKSTIGDTASKGSVATQVMDNPQLTKRFRIKMKNGEPVREHGTSISLYNISVRQAVVDNIDWEDAFDTRLDKQKGKVAETQLEKQNAELAIWKKKRVFEEGEAAKTEETAKLQKEQIQKTITAQTAAEVAKAKINEEANLLEASRKSAARKRIDADADSYQNKQMVAAGLTPQEKAEWDYKKHVDGMKAIAGPQGISLPSTYINGGGNGNSNNSDAMMLMLLKMMQEKDK